jgi:hypothetical protein
MFVDRLRQFRVIASFQDSHPPATWERRRNFSTKQTTPNMYATISRLSKVASTLLLLGGLFYANYLDHLENGPLSGRINKNNENETDETFQRNKIVMSSISFFE